MNNVQLTKARKSRGLTQQQIADSLGYKDKSGYCLLENGKINMTIETALKLKKLLNLSEEEFIEIFFDNEVEETQTLVNEVT